jgi:cytoskeletal protein CcmA (bactofilin family)
MPIETNKTPRQTVVEDGTEFKGTLKSTCPVVINGCVDGDLDAPEITVTRSGSVAGSLRATKLRAQGTLSGKVDASDVFLSGVVRSNTAIKAKRLEVKLGSDQAQIEVTFGECALEVGEALPEAALVAPAKSEAAPAVEASAQDGWGISATELVGSAATTPLQGNGTNPGRSPWKPSRTIEAAPHDTAKSTLR